MTTTILITGGGGYLGSVVSSKLNTMISSGQQPDLRVVALDIRNVPSDRRLPHITYQTADIRDPELGALFKAQAVDIVIHLASIVTPGKDSNREFEYSVDVLGTENVLKATLVAGSRKIIVSSSGAAYGYHADNPAWLTEDAPLRGNEVFAYAYHKRLVEDMLANYRREHPQLQQIIFRIGTILGATVNNQITDLFRRKQLLAIRGSDSPFVFIWDEDVTGAILQAIFSDHSGAFNLAGDGALSIHEIAAILNKPVMNLPAGLLKFGLTVLHPLGLTQYGPEQLDFLRYRPVLLNTRLKEEFGYIPQKTSREVFEFFAQRQGLLP